MLSHPIVTPIGAPGNSSLPRTVASHTCWQTHPRFSILAFFASDFAPDCGELGSILVDFESLFGAFGPFLGETDPFFGELSLILVNFESPCGDWGPLFGDFGPFFGEFSSLTFSPVKSSSTKVAQSVLLKRSQIPSHPSTM